MPNISKHLTSYFQGHTLDWGTFAVEDLTFQGAPQAAHAWQILELPGYQDSGQIQVRVLGEVPSKAGAGDRTDRLLLVEIGHASFLDDQGQTLPDHRIGQLLRRILRFLQNQAHLPHLQASMHLAWAPLQDAKGKPNRIELAYLKLGLSGAKSDDVLFRHRFQLHGDTLSRTPLSRLESFARALYAHQGKGSFGKEGLDDSFLDLQRASTGTDPSLHLGTGTFLRRALAALFDVQSLNDAFFGALSERFRADLLAPLLAQANREKVAPDKVRKLGLDLLLRLLFLRFLEAKGWILGDESWLLHQDLQGKQDAYGEVLLPLFTALAQPEGDRPKGLPAVAYLNGGLFDPQAMELDGLTLPVKEFKRFREFLYAYAFTVEESTPVDQKVAIDAEMLGRVFETLVLTMEEAENAGGTLDGALETGLGKGKTRRKVTGSYYTPRVIVQYLCRQTLDAYLTQATGEAPELWAFLRDKALDPSIEGPKGLNAPRRDRIEAALKEVRVCDPAVGSGAFLLGMMHELLLIWHGLRETEGVSVRPGGLKAADWKRHIITENLYGVDLNPEAVDICRLRLWLSLIIEAETPEPLPALDFRVLCGNSLIDRIGEHALPDSLSITSSERMGLDEVPAATTEAEAAKTLKAQFAQETRPARRRELREQVLRHTTEAHRLELEAFHKRSGGSIASLQARLSYLTSSKDQKKAQAAIATLQEEIALAQKQLDQLAADGYLKQPFLWKLAFPEVFEAGGFHLVVGNPPYVRQELQSPLDKLTFEVSFPMVRSRTADLLCYFMERSHQILREGGQIGFITSNKYMRAAYGKRLRTTFPKAFTIRELVDFGDLPVFGEKVIAYPSLFIARKGPSQDLASVASLNAPIQRAIIETGQSVNTLTVRDQLEALPQLIRAEGHHEFDSIYFKSDGWVLESPVVLDLYDRLLHLPGTVPLGTFVMGRMYRGIVTGLNGAFVIDEATRATLIHEHPSSAALIKPWLRGKDVKRWKAEWGGKYVIFTRRGTKITDYPAIHHYLAQFKDPTFSPDGRLATKGLMPADPKWDAKKRRQYRKPGSYKWFEIQDDIAYYQEFEQPKVIWPDIARTMRFAWDTSGAFSGNTTYFSNLPQWACALLNSELLEFVLCMSTNSIRGGFIRLFSENTQHLPIIQPEAKAAEAMEHLVNDAPTSGDESALNAMVYDLYRVTPAERALIQDWFRQRSISVVGDDDEEEDSEDEA
jgi:hypothetical protein